MYDCAKDILAYHDEKITLPQEERDEMRSRRDSNRERLRRGLSTAGKPAPVEFRSQGSYAMKTMTQHPKKDYDIDDGVYFRKEDLVGERGAEMSALQARQMVRDAVDDGCFQTPPEVRTNCVRVYYAKGYHVDIPVYRIIRTKNIFSLDEFHCELASANWRRSDARDVTAWFENENNTQSPDTGNGRQMRRTTRELKGFARSRDSWNGPNLSGFGITALVAECFRPDADREDRALYNTMKAIRDRLNWNLTINHPVTPNSTITAGADDPKAKFFRERLTEALDWLEPLFSSDCTSAKARKCWDKVFATDFFSAREPQQKAEACVKSPALSSGLLTPGIRQPQCAVNKQGGGTYG